MNRRRMTANLCTQVDVGEGTVGSELNGVVDAGTEGGNEVARVVVKLGKTGDGAEDVTINELVLGAPDLLSMFVNDSVLMGVGVVGKVARWGGERREVEVNEGFGDEGRYGGSKDRRGRSRRGDGLDGGEDNRQQEVLNWDFSEGYLLNDFLELEMDVGVLGFDCGIDRGVLKLRT